MIFLNIVDISLIRYLDLVDREEVPSTVSTFVG